MKRIFAVATLALALAACGGSDDGTSQNIAIDNVAEPAPANTLEAKQAQVEQSFEEAMGAVPPELREKHQAILSCMIDKNSKLPIDQQKDITPQTVNEITVKVKADPNLTGC